MDYPDKKSLPHVQVAIRLNGKGGRQFRQGDTIAYVICDDGTNNAAMQRAYCSSELEGNPQLKIGEQKQLIRSVFCSNYWFILSRHSVLSRSADSSCCIPSMWSHWRNRQCEACRVLRWRRWLSYCFFSDVYLCLAGLDPSHYHHRVGDGDRREEDDLLEATGPTIDYSHCEPFLFICPKPDCGRLNRVSSSLEAIVGLGLLVSCLL